MGIKERQERDREAVRRAILDAARELFVDRGVPERLDPKDRRTHRVQPGRHLRLLPQQGRHFLRAGRRRLPAARRSRTPPRRRSCRRCRRSSAMRAIFWRLYEFSREQPQYFALMFVDRSVPADQPRIRALRVRARDEAALIAEEFSACIDSGVFPASTPAGGRDAAADGRPAGRRGDAAVGAPRAGRERRRPRGRRA